MQEIQESQKGVSCLIAKQQECCAITEGNLSLGAKITGHFLYTFHYLPKKYVRKTPFL